MDNKKHTFTGFSGAIMCIYDSRLYPMDSSDFPYPPVNRIQAMTYEVDCGKDPVWIVQGRLLIVNEKVSFETKGHYIQVHFVNELGVKHIIEFKDIEIWPSNPQGDYYDFRARIFKEVVVGAQQ